MGENCRILHPYMNLTGSSFAHRCTSFQEKVDLLRSLGKGYNQNIILREIAGVLNLRHSLLKVLKIQNRRGARLL